MPSVTSKTAASIDASIATINAALALKADLVSGRIPDGQLPSDAVVMTAMTAAIAAAIAPKADLVSGRLPDAQLPTDVIVTASLAAALATVFNTTAFEHDQLLTLTAGLKITGSQVTWNPTVGTDVVAAARIPAESVDRFRLTTDGNMAIGSGASARDTTWGRQASAQIGTPDSDIVIGALGKGLRIKEGANGRLGSATLSAGTVTVANTSVTTNTRVFVGMKTPGGTVGAPFVSAITAGTGFTIKSTSSTDTSVVEFVLIEGVP